MITRREFSKVMLATGTATLAPNSSMPEASGSPLPAAPQSTNQTCDLLIKGGTVIDPGQKLHAVMDVAVKDRKILEVSKDIPESRALQVYSAKDKIVTPGFIDIHVHCFDGLPGAINADHYCLGRGVTTVVDAGSAGSVTIGAFVKYVVKSSTTRIYPLIEMNRAGVAVVKARHSMDDLSIVSSEATAKAALDYRPSVVGIKLHLGNGYYRSPELEMEMTLLTRALKAAELCRLPLMLHLYNPYHPLAEILKMMRKGDIFTHCFNGFGNGVLDANGKILPQVIEAQKRGIIFDVGEDLRYMSFDVAEKSIQQGFLPDSISTDLTQDNVDYQVFDMPTMLSKFLALGMNLDQVIERATTKPSQVFDWGVQIGTLRPGSEADIGIFELHDGTFEFIDSKGDMVYGQHDNSALKRVGHQRLVNKAAVCRGQLYVNQL